MPVPDAPVPDAPVPDAPVPDAPVAHGAAVTQGGAAIRGVVPRPLVLLHGFTQTGACWRPVAEVIRAHAPGLPLITPDAPGHGTSAGIRADLWQTADLLRELVSPTDPGASWAGYSMGGRMALHLALAHPVAVEKLMLISASAGIEDHAERQARREGDEALAARAEADGAPRFIERWLAQPLFSTLPHQRRGIEDRLMNTADGLASSLRLAGTGAQVPLWDRLHELGERKLPVLIVAGSLDGKYCELAARLAHHIGPLAKVHLVKGAGHACHLERPEEVGEMIARFCI